ncbi:MAG: hypothetical protein JXA11_03825 [Phycisphaerae bacterium]|nr:hypothetical protein [Phycisphaerae bacterium]
MGPFWIRPPGEFGAWSNHPGVFRAGEVCVRQRRGGPNQARKHDDPS